MKTMSKLSSAMFALAVMSSCLVVSWCQSCGTKSYGGSPSVEFYATNPNNLLIFDAWNVYTTPSPFIQTRILL
ncbi:hypothetical protein OS493_011205 [Desmophyllum pertusum]|uniref:Uncharacterized protein n=1 Tax=Desmophyllum pertusum TaxID=174260 RepID=A0A9W9Z273_9CNID|nr:hypothetical protein OS493_011205 [Desmophyllum pertusum]